MQFLRTIFWIILAVVVGLFVYSNTQHVNVQLWGGQQMSIQLWALMLVVFLLGLVPPILYYRAKIWQLKRKLGMAERNAAMAPVTPPPPSAPRREPESPFESR